LGSFYIEITESQKEKHSSFTVAIQRGENDRNAKNVS